MALRKRGRLGSPAFWLASLAVVAAPILWFIYNSVAFGDWLYFARGPYSAAAYELRNAVPGWPPHPGWHNLWVALLFFLKVSQLDSIAAAARGNVVANFVLALAALGTAAAFLQGRPTGLRRRAEAVDRRALAWTLLLWLPVPFYTWSVAYGSVPIFFPVWWPHTWYNTRYGLELLPALALGLGFAAQFAVSYPSNRFFAFARRPRARSWPSSYLLAFCILFASPASIFCGCCARIRWSMSKAPRTSTRACPTTKPFRRSCRHGHTFPGAPMLMDTSTYPEIVSLTGIPLRETINESDLRIWRTALAAPAAHAAIVVAFDGDASTGPSKRIPGTSRCRRALPPKTSHPPPFISPRIGSIAYQISFEPRSSSLGTYSELRLSCRPLVDSIGLRKTLQIDSYRML